MLLERQGFVVAGQSGNVHDLLLKVRSYQPDVAIVDVRMPPTFTDEGLQAAHEIRTRHPATSVLILSQHVETAYAVELFAARAAGIGYLLKDRIFNIDDFVAAIRRVAGGGSAIDPQVVSALIGRDRLFPLTEGERAVLALMAEGLSNGTIAKRLYLSLRAVERHIGRIFTKLGISSAAESDRRVLAVLAFLGTRA